ncbi:hypothetical protein LZ30DRAFT_249297 [Colletotrichum cereale]|nr:hypothetical protein LZ30DRAFT_249297 [Colletotrichum cereale]
MLHLCQVPSRGLDLTSAAFAIRSPTELRWVGGNATTTVIGAQVGNEKSLHNYRVLSITFHTASRDPAWNDFATPQFCLFRHVMTTSPPAAANGLNEILAPRRKGARMPCGLPVAGGNTYVVDAPGTWSPTTHLQTSSECAKLPYFGAEVLAI